MIAVLQVFYSRKRRWQWYLGFRDRCGDSGSRFATEDEARADMRRALDRLLDRCGWE